MSQTKIQLNLAHNLSQTFRSGAVLWGQHQPNSPCFNICENCFIEQEGMLYETGAQPSPDLWPLPRDNSSYHPDNPRRHGSQLSTAMMISQVLTLSIPISWQIIQQQKHLSTTGTFPFSTKPLSWVDWKKKPPTTKQHSSKSIYCKYCTQIPVVYCLLYTPLLYLNTQITTPTATRLSPSLHQ